MCSFSISKGVNGIEILHELLYNLIEHIGLGRAALLMFQPLLHNQSKGFKLGPILRP